jgi:ERCC4-type nuclease
VLLIDDREDSHITTYLSAYDVPFDRIRLEYGDCMFEGSGPHGQALIGFERKRLSDLIASMQDRRLSGHQLRGMWETFDYCYLVVEGKWQPGPGGSIEVLGRRGWEPLYFKGSGISWRQVDSYLSTLEMKGHLVVCRTGDAKETAALYVSRWHWWQKSWGDHHAHDEIYAGGPSKHLEGPGRGVMPVVQGYGLIAKVAAQLPGVDRRAFELERQFKSVREMCNASEREWQLALGFKKPSKIAQGIVRALRGDNPCMTGPKLVQSTANEKKPER